MASSPSVTTAPFEVAFRDAKALHQAGNAAAAMAHYQRLLETAPDHAELLYLLGSIYVQLNRPHEATALLDRAAALQPERGATLDMAGSAWILAEDPARAAVHFAKSAVLSPASAEHLARYAGALARCERHDEALEQFNRCLAVAPAHRQALVGAGAALANLGRMQEAEALLRRSIELHPTYATGHIALGTTLGQMERFAEAEQVLAACLTFAPKNPDAQFWLATSLHKQGRFEDALAAYLKALSLAPSNVRTLIQLAEVLIDLGRLDEAHVHLQTAVTAAPAKAAPLTALGRIEELRGNLHAAITLHDRAAAIEPDFEGTYVNRGSARRFAGDFEGALADYDKALTLKPGMAEAVANRGLSLLTLGRLREAWPEYRMRIRARAGAVDLTGAKPWDGMPLTGKRVLVWTEYGLGDEILFASFLPEVQAAAAHCTLVCSARLCTLFRRSFPGIDVIPLGDPLPNDCDVHVPLTDLAQWLRPALDTFPAHSGYLKADAGLTGRLRARYRAGSVNKLVGISWRSASGATGSFKTLSLDAWSDILKTPGVTFVSLQHGDVGADLERLGRATGQKVVLDPEIDSSRDLDAFAAQTAAMDLVISVSNTTVHVAGALGVPVWVMLPKGPGAHWYWFRDRDDNPWYPAARLFRQSLPGLWRAPLTHVAGELRLWVQS